MKARQSTRKLLAALLALPLAAGLLSACADTSASRVTLDFFQFKPEAVQEFNSLISEFEAQNPDISVRMNAVPDPDTAIRTLLVKGKTPDVLTLNGNGNYGLLAQACVFADLRELPGTKEIKPEVQKILNSVGQCGQEINALPMANNASGVLYNPEIFAEYGVSVPKTWDELIATAETFKANGINPFFMTLKDAWTVSPALVNLAAALQPPDFFRTLRSAGSDRAASTASFSKDYQEVAAKLKQLFSYAQPGASSADYNAGNKAFGEGKAAMYLNGSFSVPAIRAAVPDAKIASFAYPVTDDPANTALVSGIDVALAMGRQTPYREQAQRFIDFLLTKQTTDRYAQAQSAFNPRLDAAPQTDPALAGMADYFNQGKVRGYMDHQLPPSIPLVNISQQFVLDGDVRKFLATLDNEWFKVAARSPARDRQKEPS